MDVVVVVVVVPGGPQVEVRYTAYLTKTRGCPRASKGRVSGGRFIGPTTMVRYGRIAIGPRGGLQCFSSRIPPWGGGGWGGEGRGGAATL